MTLTITFLYDQPTDLLRKSAHFLVEESEGPAYRRYEEPGLENSLDSAADVPTRRTAQHMWENGAPVVGIALRRLQFLRDVNAAHAQIASTLNDAQAGRTAAQADQATLSGSPTQAEVLAVVRRMVNREVLSYDYREQQLNREDTEIAVLERLVRQVTDR